MYLLVVCVHKGHISKAMHSCYFLSSLKIIFVASVKQRSERYFPEILSAFVKLHQIIGQHDWSMLPHRINLHAHDTNRLNNLSDNNAVWSYPDNNSLMLSPNLSTFKCEMPFCLSWLPYLWLQKGFGRNWILDNIWFHQTTGFLPRAKQNPLSNTIMT